LDEMIDDEDEGTIEDFDDDASEGQAISAPPELDDQVKSAAEHTDEDELLTVGEEPKISVNPSPSIELLDELDDDWNET